MNITTLGIDLAKNSFSLVDMDQHGKVILRKTLKRTQLYPLCSMPYLLDWHGSMQRCSYLRAVAALTARNARLIWMLMV